ncbi:carbon catabolite repressor protein 4 homolog 3 [Mangifera indica]|uniref:carbon catabolite repressor protein 4 homolog 3 n=1 Tax=Mangifera indica TaxID=29780 RepID=UPI001CFB6E1F|nr:carbon catabolite repressor protein 4 homolog 3 [Mangifera indica]
MASSITSSSWLNRSPPVATVGSADATSCDSLKRHFFLFFTSSRSITNSIVSYSYGPTHSIRCSYRRRWLNPLRPRPLDQEPSPEIVRHWIYADSLPLVSQEKFKIASYNILGDKNAFKHKDLYPNVPLQYIKWSHRRRLICQELIGLSPDIICMQEVDRYFDLFNVMEKAGYAGSYKRRTGDNVDGCAMFWKTDSFRLLEEVSIKFKEFGLRDNVAQISVFEMCKAKSKRLVVCNNHVLYNPSRGEVKLGQICLLSSKAQIISKKWGNVPVVLAGDFNCTPQSAIYKFLSSSELEIKLYNRKDLSGQRACHPSQVFGAKNETCNPCTVIDRFLQTGWTDEEIKIATGNTDSHLTMLPLKLNSSYACVKGSTKMRDSTGEPLATSYHSKFFGTVDYLWYSNGLVPTGVLDTLPVDILRRTGGLPCKKLGSDHLALVSEFAILQGTADNHHGNNTASSNHLSNTTI